MTSGSVGDLLRQWRRQRRCSQLDLALRAGVSARHLSFVETGRSRPSPELLLALAGELDLPLRDRNALLLAGGFAPRYSHMPLDAVAMRRAIGSLDRLLAGHDPYPALVVDRAWNVVRHNAAAAGLLTGLPDPVLRPPLNVFRVCLHPDGLAARTLNLPEWGGYLYGQLRRAVAAGDDDPKLTALYDEVRGYPGVVDLADAADGDGGELLVPFRLRVGDSEVSLFTMIAAFGTPRDVTLAELAVELFFPADDATERLLRG